MMNPFRTQVKIFLDDPGAIDLALFQAIFQRWIQQKLLPGQLVDVADYRHVPDGPGIILIGHDADYSIEPRNGRLGLLFTRKHRPDEDVQAQLRSSLRLALAACQLLETEDAFFPRLRFRADELEIRYPDRLKFPNVPQTFSLIRADLNAVLSELYGEDTLDVSRVSQDPRYLFTVEVHGEGANSVADLARALQAAEQP
jgi:hypothetical protein